MRFDDFDWLENNDFGLIFNSGWPKSKSTPTSPKAAKYEVFVPGKTPIGVSPIEISEIHQADEFSIE